MTLKPGNWQILISKLQAPVPYVFSQLWTNHFAFEKKIFYHLNICRTFCLFNVVFVQSLSITGLLFIFFYQNNKIFVYVARRAQKSTEQSRSYFMWSIKSLPLQSRQTKKSGSMYSHIWHYIGPTYSQSYQRWANFPGFSGLIK